MATRQDIDLFLGLFKTRKERYGLVFFPRKRTLNGLIDLEIRSHERTEAIDGLRTEDCLGGPIPHDIVENGKYWEFKARLESREVYIRLSLGLEEGAVFCMSFEPYIRPV